MDKKRLKVMMRKKQSSRTDKVSGSVNISAERRVEGQ